MTHKAKSCKEHLDEKWEGREKLFYCKSKTVGMNKPYEEPKNKAQQALPKKG